VLQELALDLIEVVLEQVPDVLTRGDCKQEDCKQGDCKLPPGVVLGRSVEKVQWVGLGKTHYPVLAMMVAAIATEQRQGWLESELELHHS
jgi:hypothetical protein